MFDLIARRDWVWIGIGSCWTLSMLLDLGWVAWLVHVRIAGCHWWAGTAPLITTSGFAVW